MIFNTTSAGKPEQTKTATPSLSQQTIVPDSGKVLSGVIINPITAALLTSLDPDFKEANIAEGVNMFGRIGTHKSGSPAAWGTVTGSGGLTLSITGLLFAPARIVLAIKNYEANAYIPINTVYGACADKELGLRGGFVNGSGSPRGIGGTATFGNNNVTLTLSNTAGYGYIVWGGSEQYYWIALGE